MKKSLYARYGKRALDFAISSCALVVTGPIMLGTYILVKKKLGTYKFRTMTDARDADGNLLPDAERRTEFGQMLRKTSLDELPELINIWKGDMSLIGPRPLLVKYLPYYTPEENIRHEVRPGLTGLAQVHGRNTCIWEERFRYDREYVEHLTFGMDCRIIWQTIKTVLKASDIVAPGVMEDFDDYRKKQRANAGVQASASGKGK